MLTHFDCVLVRFDESYAGREWGNYYYLIFILLSNHKIKYKNDIDGIRFYKLACYGADLLRLLRSNRDWIWPCYCRRATTHSLGSRVCACTYLFGRIVYLVNECDEAQKQRRNWRFKDGTDWTCSRINCWWCLTVFRFDRSINFMDWLFGSVCRFRQRVAISY